MMLGIPMLGQSIVGLKIGSLGDLSDRCLSYTTAIFLFFALFIGSYQVFGDPIACVIDPNYPSSWINYVQDYCYVSRRYSLLPGNRDIGSDATTEKRSYENFYQWIPYLLAVQGLMVYLPQVLWKVFQGLNWNMIFDEANRIKFVSKEERILALEDIVNYIYNQSKFPLIGFNFFLNSKFRCSSYLYTLYKFTNLINIGAQLYFVSFFITNEFALLSFKDIFLSLIGVQNMVNIFLPTLVFCDYDKIELGNVQRKTVQCILPLNVFNRKVFQFLFFWLLLALLVVSISFVCTLALQFSSRIREMRIRNYLEVPILRERECNNKRINRVNLLSSLHMHKGSQQNNILRNDGGWVSLKPSNYSIIKRTMDEFTKVFKRGNFGELDEEAFYLEMEDDFFALGNRDKLIVKFVNTELQHDGCLLLELIRLNCGSFITYHIAVGLWKGFLKRFKIESEKKILEETTVQEVDHAVEESGGILIGFLPKQSSDFDSQASTKGATAVASQDSGYATVVDSDWSCRSKSFAIV